MKSLQKCIVIFIVALFSQFTFSQENLDLNKVRQSNWGNNDIAFSVSTIPSKWSDASAVIIAQTYRYEFKKPMLVSKHLITKQKHIRIILNDKKAVSDFSEFTYLSDTEKLTVAVGFKIIKPSGREFIVDEKSAVEFKNDNGESYRKLAISNLEIGDILDYYINEYEMRPVYADITIFDPVQFYLSGQYPIISQKIEFIAERRSLVSLKSVNGAPAIKNTIDKESNVDVFYVTNENVEPISDVRLVYNKIDIPSVKFRVVFASFGNSTKYNGFIPPLDEIKNTVTEEDVRNYISKETFNAPINYYERLKKNIPSLKDQIGAAYNFQRNRELKCKEARNLSKDLEGVGFSCFYSLDKFDFIKLFSTFLMSYDIDHDILMVTPRNVTTLNDLLFEDELTVVFRFKDGNEDVYFSEYDEFTNFGELDPNLYGAEAYLFRNDRKKYMGKAKFEKIKLPYATVDMNIDHTKHDINIDQALSKATITTERDLSGYFKEGYQKQVMDYYDYKDEEEKMFGKNESFYYVSAKHRDEYFKLKENYLKTRDANREDLWLKLEKIRYDLEVSKIDSFKILSTGRTNKSPIFSVKYNISIDDFMQKVGDNYLLNIGKLISQQVKINDDELDRQFKIHRLGPCKYLYDIVIKMPEGYSAEGLEEFNVNCSTSEGAFISSAKLENNHLKISVDKRFINTESPKEAWAEYVKVLNTAFDFSHKKLLLKKK